MPDQNIRRGVISPRAGTIAEVLQANGYATWALGKWHLANMEDPATIPLHIFNPLRATPQQEAAMCLRCHRDKHAPRGR